MRSASQPASGVTAIRPSNCTNSCQPNTTRLCRAKSPRVRRARSSSDMRSSCGVLCAGPALPGLDEDSLDAARVGTLNVGFEPGGAEQVPRHLDHDVVGAG